MTAAEEFLAGLPFAPDPFQREAAAAIDDGESVVVTAPTGAGKTVVAEVAVRAAFDEGRRAFYTTPIKALSNQKFGDLRDEYGRQQVGLLTGDNSINGTAPVVVMTTEVLRNMIYAQSPALDSVAVAILDEVHYLQDPARGAVWEEVIIHLPGDIRVVCLSATIANAGEFTDWVRARRGPTRLVVAKERPVPLETMYMAFDRNDPGQPVFEPIFVSGKPNERLSKLMRPGRNRRRRFGTPRRVAAVEHLLSSRDLPAIYFVFSRNGCEAAADRVAKELRLTTAEESDEIASLATARTEFLGGADLASLDYGHWVDRLQRGVAAHHAGVVPAFKETVEELFAAGLIKVVFATETLALGINMPARTVVLESLSKFTGETHELLQPGDFTQLTGRAGRRGIDDAGTAVVLHSGYVPFDRVVGIAAAGSHPLRSSFRPNYNMAVNLVASYNQAEAEALLEASFGQYQDQLRASRLAQQTTELEQELAKASRGAECDQVDVWGLVDSPAPQRSHGTVMREFASGMEAGDVVEVQRRGAPERLVVLARGTGSNPRLLVLSGTGRMQRISPSALPAQTTRLGSMTLPEPFDPHQPGYRNEAAARLRRWRPGVDRPLAAYDGVTGRGQDGACPDLDEHLEHARRVRRVEAELKRLRRRRRRTSAGLVDTFRRMIQMLEREGFVDNWRLTAKGERLRFIYNELDLRVVEAVDGEVFAGLEAAETAALASVFVFEPKPDDPEGAWPTARLAERADKVSDLDERLSDAEEKAGLSLPRPPDAGFAELAFAWANGAHLDDILEWDTAPGDFVRNCRQVLDLLRQIGDAYEPLRGQVDRASAAVDRGVVAAGGLE